MSIVRLERDAKSGVSYIGFDNDAPVARTVSLSDLVVVDLDDRDHCVGIELAMRYDRTTEKTWQTVVDYCPELKAVYPDAAALRDAHSAIPA